MKNVVNAARRFASSTAGKVTAGASSLVASGAAFASGSSSPGAAVAGELSTGKTDVMLVIGTCAAILGALILWAYVKRAR
ncbi:hypothetical protein VDG05_19585 [Xanthomonas campestris pv. raphani]|uniref:hypothetical protein n=1 Tax=Xanthomonas TaxID=338 RepID=UPI000575921A|nr:MULTISPECIES: hypothetical protein [Xanthomonas]APP84823.1 hypothetical protein BI317_12285 [Xanthomonas hortorum pv. gardneri]KHM92079.1 membrane protein [Xanthomonas vesicatoria]MEA9886498.1 hypothetical protein [Xanthomonas campestris pv. raphani]